MIDETIDEVRANNHRRVFEARVGTERLELPYAICEVPPTPEDPVARVYIDPEMGNSGFSWVLKSGAGDGIHVWTLRMLNRDPRQWADYRMFQLTCAARDCLEESGLAKREVMRRLKTSAAQLYRLLDQANTKKSMKQLVALIYALGYDVSFEVKKRETAAPTKRHP